MTVTIHQKAAEQWMQEILPAYDLPGLAAGIGTGKNGLEYAGAWGVKDVETREPVNHRDIFHMASVAKLFTGTGILLLREDGKLDLDEPVSGIVPWFETADPRSRRITVRQLLTHTSGLPDVQNWNWDRPETGEDALKGYVRSDEVRNARLLWDPEEKKFSYSDMGYELLGVIEETVTGMPFETFMETRLFKPLEMDETTFLTFRRKIEDLPAPHKKNDDNRIEKIGCYPYNRAHGPSSTLTSNVHGLAKWAAAHLNGTVLRPESVAEARKEFALVPNNGEHIGLSWFIRQQNGYTLFGHEGSDDGFRSSFWICPELDLFIIVCANLSNAPVKRINRQIFDRITEGAGPE